jgi:hypothetical protein
MTLLTTMRLSLPHGHPRASDLVSVQIGTPTEARASVTLHPFEVALHGTPGGSGSK